MPDALNALEICRIEHEPVGRKAGLTSEQLGAIRDTSTALSEAVDPTGILSNLQKSTMIYTDWVTKNLHVPQKVFGSLKALLSDTQIVEVTFTAATYNMVSRTLVALDIGDKANVPVPQVTMELGN